jgi:hypothetical protein
MSAMTYTCPHTGRNVSIGIDTDLNSFSLLPNVPVKFLCTACGKDHTSNTHALRLSDRPELDAIAAQGFVAALSGVPTVRWHSDLI